MRKEDWPERLMALIAERRSRPFAWGEQDCALFACDAVAAMTGADPAAWFRGRYRTRRGAYALLKRFVLLGLPSRRLAAPPGPSDSEPTLAVGRAGRRNELLAEAWEQEAAARGWPEIAPVFARRGDVALIDTANGEALAVCAGAAFAAAGPTGLLMAPLAAARRAWRI